MIAKPTAGSEKTAGAFNGRPLGPDNIRTAVALFALVPLLGCAGPKTRTLQPPNLPIIDLPNGAVEILPGVGVFDSPALSPDGNRLAVQVEVYRDPLLPYEIYSLAVAERDDSKCWGPVEIIQQGIYKKYLGRMEMAIQPSFDQSGDRLLVTQLRFDSLLSIPSAPTLRSRVEGMPWRGGPGELLVEHGDWDLPPTELLQHARESPNGRWLTFFTRVHRRRQGVYLLDMQSGKKYRLSTEHDKHPTWSPDGNRIWFHHQTGGKRHRFDFFSGGQETAVIGCYDLTFAPDGGLIDWTRRLMDRPGDRYLYHKHPSEVAGAGLLFFHGAAKPGGKKKLMVRRAEPGSQVYVVQPTWPGGKLKELKHPCSSWHQADLVFIAKPEGGKRYSLLLSLTADALETIRRTVDARDIAQYHQGPGARIDREPNN